MLVISLSGPLFHYNNSCIYCSAKRVEVDETAEKLKAVQEELERHKEANALTTKRMNQLANEFLTLKATYKEIDWRTKYNEAVEAQKDAEKQVTNAEHTHQYSKAT